MFKNFIVLILSSFLLNIGINPDFAAAQNNSVRCDEIMVEVLYTLESQASIKKEVRELNGKKKKLEEQRDSLDKSKQPTKVKVDFGIFEHEWLEYPDKITIYRVDTDLKPILKELRDINHIIKNRLQTYNDLEKKLWDLFAEAARLGC